MSNFDHMGHIVSVVSGNCSGSISRAAFHLGGDRGCAMLAVCQYLGSWSTCSACNPMHRVHILPEGQVLATIKWRSKDLTD